MRLHSFLFINLVAQLLALFSISKFFWVRFEVAYIPNAHFSTFLRLFVVICRFFGHNGLIKFDKTFFQRFFIHLCKILIVDNDFSSSFPNISFTIYKDTEASLVSSKLSIKSSRLLWWMLKRRQCDWAIWPV